MKRNAGRQPRVLLVLGAYDYRVHRGVVRFARENGWHLTAEIPSGANILVPWGWRGDGVIAGSGGTDELARFLQGLSVPVVDLSWRRPQLKFPRVLSDNDAIGREAAEHFLARGFRNFLFVSPTQDWIWRERFLPFEARIAQAGLSAVPSSGLDAAHDWQGRRKWLLDEVRRCAWPLAVFCANDNTAADLVDVCRERKIRVPEQVAVLGVGNYAPVCETLSVPLSSVDNNQEGQGYAGAQLLARRLRGEKLRLKPYRVPSLGVVTRLSTDVIAVDHPRVASALRMIRENFAENIGVPEIAKAAGLSRQGLNKAFLHYLGRTPGAELRRVRIERARTLLISTEEKLEHIARAVGYASANSLCLAFSREVGISPDRYRRVQ